eukprot:Pgem_evm2s7246
MFAMDPPGIGSFDAQFILYHADWCAFCKNAKPEFEKLGKVSNINGKKVKFTMVNADLENVPSSVPGYPFLYLNY